MTTASILETLMIVSFGMSWPLSIYRSLTSHSTKGKSLLFMCFIEFGYFCGIGAKIASNNLNLAFWFYILNTVMVAIDLCLYFYNRSLEKKGEAAGK